MTAQASPTQIPPTNGKILSLERAILGPARVGTFQNSICRLGLIDGAIPRLTSTHETNDFSGMQRERKAAERSGRPSAELWKEMLSASGVRLSNVGVSVATRLTIGATSYLVGVRQVRQDFRDVVVKIPSGYTNFAPQATSFGAPRTLADITTQASNIELSEEILPWAPNPAEPEAGSLLRGLIRTAKAMSRREFLITDREGLPLRLAQPEQALGTPFSYALPYLDGLNYRLTPSAKPMPLPSLAEVVPIELDDEVLYAGIYVSLAFQAAQIVFFYDLELPNCEGLSLSHCENVFEPNTKTLLEEYQRYGAPLLELGESNLPNGKTFVLDSGKLVDTTDIRGTTLSEAFVKCDQFDKRATGIVSANNIPLSAFLGSKAPTA